jgi:hypothetical protein
MPYKEEQEEKGVDVKNMAAMFGKKKNADSLSLNSLIDVNKGLKFNKRES